jgi:hypothetical protein
MTRAMLGVLAGLLVAIAAANFSYGVSSDIGDEPAHEAWARSTMNFVSWNNEEWTARIHAGKFHLVPQNDSDWSRHSNASIAFTDWEGDTWQAKIDGEIFLLAAQGNWLGPVERVDALRYRDWTGSNQIRTVADLER